MTRWPAASARNSSRLGATVPSAPGVPTGELTGADMARILPGAVVGRPAARQDVVVKPSNTDAASEAAAPRRRGRRPGGGDTRTALLDAARAAFVELGYNGATVRGIAERAGVDAAM